MYRLCARSSLCSRSVQMITELASMMEERLKAFQARSKTLPQRILVYRDGVSEVRESLVAERPCAKLAVGTICDRRGGGNA